jgi:N-acyl-L-homoserine lactone synthetase
LRSTASTRPQQEQARELSESSVVFTRWYAATDNRGEAFALRHRGYVAAGLIEQNPLGLYSDPYDELDTTIVAGLFRRGACISTLRLSFWKPDCQTAALPCEKVYPEIAEIKAKASGMVVEVSRLAIDPGIDNTRYRSRLYAASIRAGMMACIAMDARQILIATQTKWRPFYEHVLGFKAVGPPQFYPPGNVPVVLLARDLDDDMRQRVAKNMFFKFDETELSELKTLLPPMIEGG